ncbi:hypothetical protein Tco_0053612 [Tanacetum coccineum]
MVNLFLKHELVSRSYSKKSLIMALIFGSKSKFFMIMSLILLNAKLTTLLVENFMTRVLKNLGKSLRISPSMTTKFRMTQEISQNRSRQSLCVTFRIFRKEAKGKKVVSSLDFQEEVDAGAEQVNTAKRVNTGSIKLSTVSEQLSTGSEQVSTVGAKKSTSSHMFFWNGHQQDILSFPLLFNSLNFYSSNS